MPYTLITQHKYPNYKPESWTIPHYFRTVSPGS